jgi:hypothetical protein
MGPGVTRANTVLVWQVGQIGRRMGMMLSPLVQAGALQNSQSPVDTEGGGDDPRMHPLKFHRWSILTTFQKLIQLYCRGFAPSAPTTMLSVAAHIRQE